MCCADDTILGDVGNPILFCDSCNLPVHAGCYLLHETPAEDADFICDICSHGSEASTPTCVLCAQPGGAMRRIDGCTWVHPACAIYNPHVDVHHVGSSGELHLEKPSARKHRGCSVAGCEDPTAGCHVACGGCGDTKVAHVSCAQAIGSGWHIRLCNHGGPEVLCPECVECKLDVRTNKYRQKVARREEPERPFVTDDTYRTATFTLGDWCAEIPPMYRRDTAEMRRVVQVLRRDGRVQPRVSPPRRHGHPRLR